MQCGFAEPAVYHRFPTAEAGAELIRPYYYRVPENDSAHSLIQGPRPERLPFPPDSGMSP